MQNILMLILFGVFLLSGCSNEKNLPDTTKSSVVEQSAPSPQQIESIDTLPAKISVMPSIGATRSECEKYYRPNAENGRYNNDEYLISFLDEKNNRAYVFILQPEKGKNYNLDDFMPSDAQILNVEEKEWLNLILKVTEGKSVLLEQVCPESKGYFRSQTSWDKETHIFAGADFTIDFSR